MVCQIQESRGCQVCWHKRQNTTHRVCQQRTAVYLLPGAACIAQPTAAKKHAWPTRKAIHPPSRNRHPYVTAKQHEKNKIPVHALKVEGRGGRSTSFHWVSLSAMAVLTASSSPTIASVLNAACLRRCASFSSNLVLFGPQKQSP